MSKKSGGISSETKLKGQQKFAIVLLVLLPLIILAYPVSMAEEISLDNNNPTDDIKWSFTDEVDPFWYGIGEKGDKIKYELERGSNYDKTCYLENGQRHCSLTSYIGQVNILNSSEWIYNKTETHYTFNCTEYEFDEMMNESICINGYQYNDYNYTVEVWSEPEYVPFEDYVNVDNTDGSLTIIWKDGSIQLSSYIKDTTNAKSSVSDLPVLSTSNTPSKGELKLQTNVLEGRGGFYYNQTMDDKKITEFGYDIISTTKYSFDGNRLVFDVDGTPVSVDFTQAKDEQNIELAYDKKTNELSMKGDLSYIDPTISIQTASSSDDARERESSGVVTLTDSDLIIWSDPNDYSRYWRGDRFILGITIPKGSTITLANISGYYPNDGHNDANFNIHFELTQDPVTFSTNTSNITARPRTTASTPWVEDDIIATNTWIDTPSIITPLQELVNTYSVSTVAVIYRPNQDASKALCLRSWDATGNNQGTRLHIDYTEPAPVVTFVPPTDDDSATITNRNYTYINVSITNYTAIDRIVWNWNGTNTSNCASGDDDNGDGTCNATFYPDANPETSSVDGYVYDSANNKNWSDLIAEPGNNGIDTPTQASAIYISSSTTENNWSALNRGIFLFDTSSLPDGATLITATFSLRGYNKYDLLSITPDINIYSSNPASNTSLVAGDFDSLGTTAYCDTPITYDGWVTNGYNDFVLNDLGIGNISKTGITKLGIRNTNYDVAEIAPNWSSDSFSSLGMYFADQSGTTYDPKLVIKYKPGISYINKTDLADGQYTYYAWVNDSNGNYNQTETRTITFSTGGVPDTTPPVVTLDRPADGNVSYDNNITLYCNVTEETGEIKNITLWTNITGTWIENNTIDLSGQALQSYTFEVNLTDLNWDEIYKWNCQAYDNSSNEGWASSNWTFTVTAVSIFVDIIPSSDLVDGIQFGNVDPGTSDNAATRNSACSGTCYNVTIDPATSVNVDLYHKTSGNLGTVGIGNVTHQANITSNNGDNLIATGSIPMTTSYAIIGTDECQNMGDNVNCWIRYWIDIPTSQTSGNIETTYYYCAVETGQGSGECT